MPKPGQKDHILAKGHKLYTVKQGDTLWSISKNECGGKGAAWKDNVLAYNQWLIDEGRYDQDKEHVLIKVGEVLDIYTDFHG